MMCPARSVSTFLFLWASVLAPPAAWGLPFQSVVALGDSLFDSGPVLTPNPAQHLAARAGVPLHTVAQGGATTSSLVAGGQPAAAIATRAPFALLWIGGNDFAGHALEAGLGLFGFIDDMLTNVEAAVVTLRSAGLEVAVLGLFDAASTPFVDHSLDSLGILDPGVRATIRGNARASTETYDAGLAELAGRNGALYVDLFSVFDDVIADPASAGLPGGALPVLPPATGYPAGCPLCLFWDDLHPSRLGQGLLANRLIDQLNAAYGAEIPRLSSAELGILTVPEPATDVMLLVGMLLLLVGVRSRRAGDRRGRR